MVPRAVRVPESVDAAARGYHHVAVLAADGARRTEGFEEPTALGAYFDAHTEPRDTYK